MSSSVSFVMSLGADIIGIDGILESLERNGKKGPDVIICAPELMASLSAHGKALGTTQSVWCV